MQDPGSFNYGQTRQLLKRILEGMEVFDREGRKIGVVEHVHLGSHDDTGRGPADVSRVEVEDKPDSIIENLAEGLGASDDLPDEMKDRLLLDGFIRMDSNQPLASDRFILPDQIKDVRGDQVILNSTYDDLLKPQD